MKRLILFLCTVQLAHGAPSDLPPQAAPQTKADANVHLRAQEENGLHFTLKQAEAYALANHPRIAASKLNAEAVRQEIRQARSQFFPQVYAEADAVYADQDATRLAAPNGLNNPSIYSRQSDGFVISQLITDFGHTYELTESARFRADAAADRTNVARALIVLQVDRSYFNLLRARAIKQVADQTVNARQVAFNQISTLARNQLKSTLDANFAQENLSEARLLQIQAQSDVSGAEAELSTALGFPDAERFVLTEEPLDPKMPPSPDDLIRQAMQQRPEMASLHNEQEAALRFAKAQDASRYPKVTALGAAGINPVADDAEFKKTYYAAGVNVELPVLTGGNLDAKAKQAHLLAEASLDNLIDAQNTITRDVRIAWLAANTAKQRLSVTQELIQTSQQAQKLADARYRLGTSSIVELIQAQLNYTEAQLQDTSARYDYQSGRALLNFTIGAGL